jgi:hypothetical protein
MCLVKMTGRPAFLKESISIRILGRIGIPSGFGSDTKKFWQSITSRAALDGFNVQSAWNFTDWTV